MSEQAKLTQAEVEAMTAALASDGGCWDYEQCCWASFESLRPVVEEILSARLSAAEATLERVREFTEELAHPDTVLIVAHERAVHRSIARQLIAALKGAGDE